MADVNINDSLRNALKAVQLLRANVSKVFETLTQGSGKKDDKQQIAGYLSQFQKELVKVNENFSQLEKQASNIHAAAAVRQGNLGLLSVEAFPSNLAALYPRIVNTYRWSERAHEYADRCIENLQSHSLKRSYIGNSLTSKRLKPHITAPHAVMDELVERVLRTLVPHSSNNKVTWQKPFGSPTVVLVTIGRLMNVLMVLRGLLIEHVNVKAFTESFTTDSGKYDIWSSSKQEVFRKISQHAKAASLHISNPEFPEITLKAFVTWLESYSTLFTSPCAKCKSHLKDFLPPTWRDFEDYTAYHEGCRS